jgi:hypothetical protein
MEPEKKKTMLYVGGALASIVALILYMKNKQSAAMPTMSPAVGGAGSSSNPALAAEIQAATALTQSQIAAQIAAGNNTTALGIAQIVGNTTINAANINASGAKTAAVIGAVGGATGSVAVKGILDILKGLLGGGPGEPTTAPTQNSPNSALWKSIGWDPNTTIPGIPEGTVTTLSSYVPPGIYDTNGVIGAGTVLLPGSNYYQGNTGGGDSSWFGSAPGDATALNPIENPFSAVSP